MLLDEDILASIVEESSAEDESSDKEEEGQDEQTINDQHYSRRLL